MPVKISFFTVISEKSSLRTPWIERRSLEGSLRKPSLERIGRACTSHWRNQEANFLMLSALYVFLIRGLSRKWNFKRWNINKFHNYIKKSVPHKLPHLCGTVAHAYHPSYSRGWGKFKAIWGNLVKSCLKIKTNRGWGWVGLGLSGRVLA